eukprot:6431340-Ditylum_brightwellii.AAC.1
MTEATASTRLGNKDKTTFFFTNAKQMEVAENLKHPRGLMNNPDKEHGNDNPSTIAQTPYPFG